MFISVRDASISTHQHVQRHEVQADAAHSSMLIPIVCFTVAGVGIGCLVALLILHHHTRRRRRPRHPTSDLALPRSPSDESFVSGPQRPKPDYAYLDSSHARTPELQTYLPSPPLTPPFSAYGKAPLSASGKEQVQALTTAHSLVAFPVTLPSSMSVIPLRPRALTSPGRVHRAVMGFEQLAASASGGEGKGGLLDSPSLKARLGHVLDKPTLPTPASSKPASPILPPVRLSSSTSMLALLTAAGLVHSSGARHSEDTGSSDSDEDGVETASEVDRCDSGTAELDVVSSYEDTDSEEDDGDYEPLEFPLAPTGDEPLYPIDVDADDDEGRLAYLSDSPRTDSVRDSVMSTSAAGSSATEDEYGEPTMPDPRLSSHSTETTDSSCSDRSASLPSEEDRPTTAQSRLSVVSFQTSGSDYSTVNTVNGREDLADQLTRLSPLPISPLEPNFVMHERVYDGRYPPFLPSPVFAPLSPMSPTITLDEPNPSVPGNNGTTISGSDAPDDGRIASTKYDPAATRSFVFGSTTPRTRVASPALPSLATGLGVVGLGLSLGLGSQSALRSVSGASLESVSEDSQPAPARVSEDGIYSPGATRSRRVSHRPGLSLPGGVGHRVRPTLTLLPPDSHRHRRLHQRAVSESSTSSSDTSRSTSPMFNASSDITPASSACPTPTFPPPIPGHVHARAALVAESSILVKIYYSPTAPTPRPGHTTESQARTTNAKETIKFRLPRTAVFGELCIKAWEKLGVAVRLVMYDGDAADAVEWAGDSISGKEVGAGEWRDVCDRGWERVYFWARDA